jgi:hypothetical protein
VGGVFEDMTKKQTTKEKLLDFTLEEVYMD